MGLYFCGFETEHNFFLFTGLMILSYGEVIFEITNFKDEDLVTPKEGEREIGICGKLNQKVPG